MILSLSTMWMRMKTFAWPSDPNRDASERMFRCAAMRRVIAGSGIGASLLEIGKRECCRPVRLGWRSGWRLSNENWIGFWKNCAESRAATGTVNGVRDRESSGCQRIVSAVRLHATDWKGARRVLDPRSSDFLPARQRCQAVSRPLAGRRHREGTGLSLAPSVGRCHRAARARRGIGNGTRLDWILGSDSVFDTSLKRRQNAPGRPLLVFQAYVLRLGEKSFRAFQDYTGVGEMPGKPGFFPVGKDRRF
jgi:hypothetical protein